MGNNKCNCCDDKSEQVILNRYDYVRIYVKEVFEAFIGVLIVSYLNPKIDLDMKRVVGISWFIGSIIFFFQLFDERAVDPIRFNLFGGISGSWF